MIRTNVSLVVLLLSLGVLLAHPSSGQDAKAFLPENPDLVLWQNPESAHLSLDVDEQRVTEEAYALLERRFQDSGHDVTLVVSNFHTVYENRFGTTFWTDLVSLPTGRLLDVEVTELVLADLEISKVHFKPTWVQKDDGSTPGGAQLAAMSLGEALRLAGAQDPNLLLTEAVTSYQVTVSFEGEEREYRAAVLWQPAASGVGMLIQDHIVQGVEDAVVEAAPSTPFTNPADLRQAEATDLAEGASYKPAGDRSVGGEETEGQNLCVQSFRQKYKQPLSVAGSNRHNTGGHGATIEMATTCDCEPNCVVDCTPYFLQRSCYDNGDIQGVSTCHRTATKVTLTQDTGVETAQCHAGQGCFVQSCPFCICGGITITAEVRQTGITFNTTAEVIFDASLSATEICACEPCI